MPASDIVLTLFISVSHTEVEHVEGEAGQTLIELISLASTRKWRSLPGNLKEEPPCRRVYDIALALQGHG